MSPKAGSDSKSQLKLSRKPRRSVVSDGEKRSADGGNGAADVGNKFVSAGSNAYSKSANGTGGWGDMVDDNRRRAIPDSRCHHSGRSGRDVPR